MDSTAVDMYEANSTCELPGNMSEEPRDRTQDGTITQGSKDTFELSEIHSALPLVHTLHTGLIPQEPTLEGLATEVRLCLLHHIFDIASLKALIRAVPAYHSAYDLERYAILRSVLANCLGSEVIIDALALVNALDIRRDLANHALVDGVKAFMEKRKHFMEKRKFCRSPGLLDLPGVPRQKLFLLARLEARVESMTDIFVPSPIKLDNGGPSPSELRRIRRALYRFELFCVLFGRSSFGESQAWRSTNRYGTTATAEGMQFLALLEPWEVEEMACVRDYAFELYQKLYQAQQQTLNPPASEGSGLSSTPLCNRRTLPFAEACMSCGLGFMVDIVHAAAPEKQSMLQENQIQGYVFLTEYLQAEPYDHVNHTARYNEWRNALFLPFIGDHEGPNLAWVWLNKYKVQIFYFEEATTCLREWAYVMWDMERVNKRLHPQ